MPEAGIRIYLLNSGFCCQECIMSHPRSKSRSETAIEAVGKTFFGKTSTSKSRPPVEVKGSTPRGGDRYLEAGLTAGRFPAGTSIADHVQQD